MNLHKLFVAIVIAFVLFTSAASAVVEVNAQGACPTSGTYGKDVSRDFFVQVVGLLKNVPQSDFAVDALMARKPYESTNAYWNPLATTWKMSPVCDFNSVGVQNYVDQGNGVLAIANTLNLGYYDPIRKMLRLEAFDREAMRSSLGTWGTCSGLRCDSLLDQWQELYNHYTGGIGSNNTTTVFVFDTSGSMEKPDASGVVKLDAAENAGITLLEVIGAENQAGLSSNEVAIVEFSDSAIVNLRLTTDIKSAEDALRALYPAGGTAMPKGLKAALDLFPSNPTNQSFIILLSDGLPNIGINDENDEIVVRQQVLDLSTEAGQRGICVFTVGFGDPSLGTIDEAFLQQVASNSGCGTYHNAQNASELANIYISLRHAATGITLLEKSGSINQDQLLDIDNVQIPDNQAMMLFTLNWPGSQLDAILRDPTGVVVDQNYPGAHIALTDTLASIIIQNPQAGLWNVSARGVDIPGGITTYNAVLSVRANVVPPTPIPVTPTPVPVPTSGGSPLAIVFIVLAAAGMMVYVMTQTQKRVARQTRAVYVFPAVLIGLNGTFAGRSIPLKDGLLIGRSSACAVCLYEDIVSRQHARLRYMNGRWYIQDLNSQSGVYINGARVQAAALNKGDRIRIGSTEFDFR